MVAAWRARVSGNHQTYCYSLLPQACVSSALLLRNLQLAECAFSTHTPGQAVTSSFSNSLHPGLSLARLPCQCLQLPATAVHDVATAPVILRNTTADPQTFEFSIPQGSDLTLSPHVGTIQAGATLCVMLRHCPQPSTAPAAPEESIRQQAAAAGVAGSSNSNTAIAAADDGEEIDPVGVSGF